MTMYDDDRVVTLLREVDLPLSPPDRLGEVRRRARGHDSRRAGLVAGLMAVVLAAGVVSAINLGHRGNTDVLTVAGAVRATMDTGSARVTFEIEITGGSFTLGGPVDFAHNRYRLVGSIGGFPIEMRGIGMDRWTKGGGLAAGAKSWVHSTESAPERLASTTQPVVLLRSLVDKGKQLSSRRDGERTTLVLRVPEGVLSGIADQTDLVDVTVSVDGNDLIRSLTYETSASGPSARLTMRYDDFGIDVHVQPPPADQVQEASATAGSSGTSQTFTLNGSSPEDRKNACEQLKAVRAQMPAGQSEQEKKAREVFDRAVAKACAAG
jgi:hypothetical protein